MKNETPRWWKRIAITATLIAACIGVVGCVDTKRNDIGPHQQVATVNRSHYFVERIEVGECAYVVYDGFESGHVVHAGDCRNPNHKENQR